MHATNTIPKSIFLAACTAIIASACYALIPETTTLSLSDPAIAENLKNDPLPQSFAAKANKTPAIPDFKITDHLIESGESLSLIFSKYGIAKQDLHNIVQANKLGKQFAAITPGKNLRFETTQDGELQQLSYSKNLAETLIAKRFGENFQVEISSKPVEYRPSNAQVQIQSGLYLDAKRAGLSDKLIMELSHIFAWEIDFAKNLQIGDQFAIVYEKRFINGLEIGTGDILAAEFINKGRSYQAVRFQDEQGKRYYYSPEGKSLKKAFLSTPIKFARISSYFNLRRKHPVLNRIRAHKGVDYAARSGTPIKTTGNGKITYRGRKGGYGNVIIIQHSERYSTLYAHLSNFKRGQKLGSRVTQGETIGYVGQTGLASGPHLHYEFLVNGIQRNPLTAHIPNGPAITKAQLAAFKQQTQPLLAQLQAAKLGLSIAQNKLDLYPTLFSTNLPLWQNIILA